MLDLLVKNPAMMKMALDKARKVLKEDKGELPEYIKRPATELFDGLDRWQQELKAKEKKNV
jgi:hypothetical protein